MTANKRMAIRSALAHLGMYAAPGRVIEFLEGYGVEVSEELVSRVRMQAFRSEAKAMRERSKQPPKNKSRSRPQQRKIPHRGR